MKKRILIIGVTFLAGVSAYATVHNHIERTPEDIDDSKKKEVHTRLLNNTPADVAVGGGPSFVFLSKNSKFVLGIGGSVKATVSMDMGHPIDSPDEFTISQIPMRKDMDGNGSKFNMSAHQTSLYLNFIALPGTSNEIGAFVNFNLLDNYVPTLQFAYLRYRGFQAGYDYTLFSDVADLPPTIDFEGPNASTAIPTTGIRYGFDFGKKKEFNFGVGAELPMNSYTTAPGYTRTVSQRVPDIPVALKYNIAGGDSWIRLSGMVRNLYYRNQVMMKNVDKIGFGVQLDGAVNILPNLTGYFQGVYGKGISSYIQDLTGEGMDLVPSDNGNTMKTVPAWGAFGGLEYKFTNNVYCSATYSHVRAYAGEYKDGETSWGDLYSYGQYAIGNLFWNINDYVTTGVEYIWGRRVNNDGLKCSDNRIQAMIQLNF